MREVTLKVYPINELKDKVKEKIIERYRYFNTEGFDWYEDEYLLDSLLPKEFQGDRIFNWKYLYFDFDRDRYIQFSELEILDRERFLKFLGLPNYDWISFSFDGKKNCSTKLSLEIVEYLPDIDEEVLEKEVVSKLFDSAEEKFDDLMIAALKSLEKGYEYLTSDEQVIESLNANDFEFLENGREI